MADESARHGEALAPKTRWRQPAPRLTCNTLKRAHRYPLLLRVSLFARSRPMRRASCKSVRVRVRVRVRDCVAGAVPPMCQALREARSSMGNLIEGIAAVSFRSALSPKQLSVSRGSVSMRMAPRVGNGLVSRGLKSRGTLLLNEFHPYDGFNI